MLHFRNLCWESLSLMSFYKLEERVFKQSTNFTITLSTPNLRKKNRWSVLWHGMSFQVDLDWQQWSVSSREVAVVGVWQFRDKPGLPWVWSPGWSRWASTRGGAVALGFTGWIPLEIVEPVSVFPALSKTPVNWWPPPPPPTVGLLTRSQGQALPSQYTGPIRAHTSFTMPPSHCAWPQSPSLWVLPIPCASLLFPDWVTCIPPPCKLLHEIPSCSLKNKPPHISFLCSTSLC